MTLATLYVPSGFLQEAEKSTCPGGDESTWFESLLEDVRKSWQLAPKPLSAIAP